jgi:glycosyltransferase involved in cell wall biosynthesis
MNASPVVGLRIGIASEGKLDPFTWSGTPDGLAGGLRSYGVEIAHLRSSPPETLERLLWKARWWRLQTAARRATLAVNGRRASALDAIVLIGSATRPRTRLPIVTYEDMTVRQALAVKEPWVAARSRRELDAWIARQGTIYTAASAICTMGRWAAESIVGEYGADRSRVHVVGAGVNHVVEAPEARDWSRPRFLFVGREFERKNGPLVLRAFAALRAEHPNAQLDVVGGHPPIDQPGVVGHGRLTLGDPAQGAKLDELFRRATCFVMPSRYEPFGIVYAEAATAGLPSIATSVGGTFVDDSCGIVVDPGDEQQLLAAMRALADGENARSLGERARHRAPQFTWRAVAGRVLRSVMDALGRPTDGLPPYL